MTSEMLENYTVSGILGSGAFGAVCKVLRKVDAKEFACKSVTYAGMDDALSTAPLLGTSFLGWLCRGDGYHHPRDDCV